MKIGSFDTDQKVLIVAEIGNNHEGNFDRARELVLKAKECGVDAVKFQTFKTKDFVSPTEKARFDRLQSFELSHNQFQELHALAHGLGLLFISTPFDVESARFLTPLVDAFKIASGDNNHWELLKEVSKTKKPMIVSTGMSDLEDIKKCVSFIGSQNNLALLHCVSLYPTPPGEANLFAINLLQKEFGITIGYSDHTLGILACLLAVGAGARILEKHFTSNKNQSDFRDHQLSADIPEMKELVLKVREAEILMGQSLKKISANETQTALAARRSIAAKHILKKNHILTLNDFAWLRPGTGLPPGEEGKLLNKKLKIDKMDGELILLSDVE